MLFRALRRALPLAALLLIAAATPALAHDQLQTTNPTDGAVLDALPTQIDLTYNNEVLPLAPVVVLRDAAGTDLSSAEPTVNGAVVTLPWPADVTTGGDFTVAWRVVSSDGHPIEGSFAFTATVPGPTAPTPTEEPVEAPTPVAAEPAPTQTPENPTNRTPYLLAGGALVLLLLIALLVRRTQTRKDTP